MTDGQRVVRLIITGSSAGALKAMAEVEAGSDKLSERSKALGGNLKKAGSTMTALAVPLVALGVASVKAATDFQSSMTLLQTQAGASAREVKNLSSSVLALGPKVAEGPNDLAQALYPIESVGLRGAQAMQALTASSKGAQISGAGLVETSDAMSGALRTQLKDIHNASDAMSIMNGIVGLGKMHLVDLTEAMATGILPQAKQVGLGFRDLGAAIDAMTKHDIPAAVEATRMRLTLTQMTAPAGSALKALQSIGLQQFSLADALRGPKGLVGALKLLREHLQGLSKDQQTLVLSEAFGKSKGSANVIGLLNALPEMEQVRQKLAGYGEKQLNQAFGVRSQTAAFKFQQSIASLKTGLVQLGHTLLPVVVPGILALTHVLVGALGFLSHMPKPIRDIVIGFTLLLAIGGPMLIFAGTIVNAIGIISGAMEALGLSLSFNPVLLAMGAVAVGIVLIATHFKQFSQAVEIAFNAVASVVSTVFTGIVNLAVQGINLIIKAIDTLIKGYNDIPGFLRPTGKIGEIGQLHELNVHHNLVTAAAGHHGGGHGSTVEVHHQPIHTQIFLDRHAQRPLAEMVTEYQLKMEARK